MKKLLLILGLLITGSMYAADGDVYMNHIKRLYTTTLWNSKAWGLLKLPDDFYSTNKKYPILVFHHGRGEVGTTEADVPKLISIGPNYYISQGNKMEFINPRDGILCKFIVVSFQDFYWSARPEQVKYVLQNDPIIKDRIDPTAIYLTGLSAGGSTTIDFIGINEEYGSMIAAVVPMSPGYADPKTNLEWAIKYKVKAWSISGNSDGEHTTYAQWFTDGLNAGNPGIARFTIFNGGHCCWNTYYNPSYRETIGGIPMNIYEWMLFNKKSEVTPVVWIEVIATRNINSTLIEWTVADEQDCAYYEIEKSEDGRDFKSVGRVLTQAPDGNSNQILKYKFTVK